MKDHKEHKEHRDDGIYKWLALFVVVIGTFMAILDSSIVNIAMPKMMAVFGVSLEDAKWIITAYALALGAIIPLTGFLGDIFGTKRLYMYALAMFTVGSLLCGFAWNNMSMIIFRIIQALGGGMIMPIGMSIIYQIFPQEERGTALGVWGIAAMAAPTIGPTLGGYIIEYLDWRLIFNVNVPVGVVGVIFAWILLKETPRKPFKGFDIIGFLSATVGLVSILYVLGEGTTIDWGDIKNPILIAVGVASLILFVANELTHPDPLLDLRVFSIAEFSLSQVITCSMTLALMGGMYILPVFFQNMRGFSAIQTGLMLLPSAVVTGIMMPISGKLFDKFGAKPVVIPGLIILAISSFELAKVINLDTSKQTFIWITVIRSIGIGLAMMPVSTLGMNAVPMRQVGRASAISNTIRQVMGAVSVTIVSTVMTNNQNLNYARLSEQVNSYNQPTNDLVKGLQGVYMQGGLAQSAAQGAALSTISGLVQRQAYIDAMGAAAGLMAFAVIVSIVLAFFLKEKKKNIKADSTAAKSGDQSVEEDSHMAIAFE